MGGIFGLIGQGISSFFNYNAKVKTGGQVARMEEASAASRAKLIRTRAREAKGAATAAYAASGVDVSQGTPLETQRQISYESEHDALLELLMGKRRAQAARSGAQLSADSSLVSSAADAYSGWLRSRGAGTTGGVGSIDAGADNAYLSSLVGGGP